MCWESILMYRAWIREYGDGQRGYFMAPARYWHWQGGNARPGEGGEPATCKPMLMYVLVHAL
jgi:hypothetical protein